METITFTREINSDTLTLPELRPLIGQTVQITIRSIVDDNANGADRWQPLRDAAGKDLVDPDVYRQHREYDKQQYGTI